MSEAKTMMLLSTRGPTGPVLAMLTKRVYRLSAGRRISPAGDDTIREAPLFAPSSNPGAGERMDADSDLFAAMKPSTDVLVRGAAHSMRGPVRMLDTALRAGPARKNVRVWGERRLQLGPGNRLTLSEPEPFTSLPLLWDHAYGGCDTYAEGKLYPRAKASFARPSKEPHGAIGYPRNAAGRGFYLDLDLDRVAGAGAPRLEDPEDPITPDRLLAQRPLDWLDRPAAACYEPMDWFTFPRVVHWLGVARDPPQRPVYELRAGMLRAEDMEARALGTPADPRAYNCAPAGLSSGRLLGNERVSLWNMHPKHELLEFELPGERPRMLLEPPGCGAFELPPRLQTVLIEPGDDRVTLTWAGTLNVAAPYPEEMCQDMRSVIRWA